MTNWSVKAIKQVAEVRLGKMVQPSPTSDLQVGVCQINGVTGPWFDTPTGEVGREQGS